jgi:hypothetical protein
VDRICEDCNAAVRGKMRRGRCENCYRRHLGAMKRAGNFAPVPREQYAPRRDGVRSNTSLFAWPVPAVFRNVTPGWGGCWIYTGQINEQGYGQANGARGKTGAHRVAFQLAHGPIPAGLHIDHTCHTESVDCPSGRACIHRRCINPGHLEAVTPRENTLRSLNFCAVNALKTHCIHDHEFTPENTYWRRRADRGNRMHRECRTCRRELKKALSPRSQSAA